MPGGGCVIMTARPQRGSAEGRTASLTILRLAAARPRVGVGGSVQDGDEDEELALLEEMGLERSGASGEEYDQEVDDKEGEEEEEAEAEEEAEDFGGVLDKEDEK